MLTAIVARWIAMWFLFGLIGEAIELADFFSLLFSAANVRSVVFYHSIDSKSQVTRQVKV